jgi:hypothetical protein
MQPPTATTYLTRAQMRRMAPMAGMMNGGMMGAGMGMGGGMNGMGMNAGMGGGMGMGMNAMGERSHRRAGAARPVFAHEAACVRVCACVPPAPALAGCMACCGVARVRGSLLT